MNELHEIYAKLLKRGMPEHPRLASTYDGHTPIWVLTGDSGERLELATFGDPLETDARDLLTMHALRWFVGLTPKHKYAGRSALESAGADPERDNYSFPSHLRTTLDSVTGRCNAIEELLPAILAATTHLEGA